MITLVVDNTTKSPTKDFILVQDYTNIEIWDHFVREALMRLKTKPKGWPSRLTAPEGNWTFGLRLHNMASDGAYAKSSIIKPEFNQLPAIYCVVDGVVESKFNVTGEQALEFIKKHLGAEA